MTSEPYRPTAVEARVAGSADLAAVAETMAQAFYADPVWGWAFPDPKQRLEQHRIFWRFMAESTIDYEWIWLTEGCASASLWIPPGLPELRPEDEERMGPLLEELLGDGAARVLEAFECFEAVHPREEPHYYLSLLGTHPDHSGRGLGMGLLADNLTRIDAEGAPAFLESSNPANDHRYERLGFAKCGEFELPEDGPNVTQMWRERR
jgi:GNAT superfamily N-acetyltransferase